MIEKLRDKIETYIGKNIKFEYNYGRNQIESFNGKVVNIYPAVFTIKVTTNGNESIKCFSYNDVLIGILKIIE